MSVRSSPPVEVEQAVSTRPLPEEPRRSGGAPRWLRPALGLALLFVALSAGVALLGRYLPEPSGPAGSSYATSPAGLAAYAELLGREGRTVRSLRERPATARLDPVRATLVITALAPLQVEDVRAIRRFAERGGRVLAAGREAGKMLARPPRWAPARAGAARPRGRAPETNGVATVLASDGGTWREPGEARPVLRAPTGALLVVARTGRGRVALLADPSPLSNAGLARVDNAALGLAVAGERGRRVVFAESVHGFEPRTGLAALPERWRWALGGLLLAGVALLLSRLRRLGPPEAGGGAAAPARADYVRALAGAIDRSGRPGQGVAPVRAHARELLARRAGLSGGPSDDELRRAAAAAGLDSEESAALVDEPRHPNGALAAGRALARLWGDMPGERRVR